MKILSSFNISKTTQVNTTVIHTTPVDKSLCSEAKGQMFVKKLLIFLKLQTVGRKQWTLGGE